MERSSSTRTTSSSSEFATKQGGGGGGRAGSALFLCLCLFIRWLFGQEQSADTVITHHEQTLRAALAGTGAQLAQLQGVTIA